MKPIQRSLCFFLYSLPSGLLAFAIAPTIALAQAVPDLSAITALPGSASSIPSALQMIPSTAVPAGTPVITPIQTREIYSARVPVSLPYPAVIPAQVGAPVQYPAQGGYPKAPVVYPAMPLTQTVSPTGVSVQVQVEMPQSAGYSVAQPYQGGYPQPEVTTFNARRQNFRRYGIPQLYQGGYPQSVYPTPFIYPTAVSGQGYPGYATYPTSPYNLIAPGAAPSDVLSQTINQEWLQKLVAADRLYREGQFQQAEQLFREAMSPLATANNSLKQVEAVIDPTLLPTNARVYWEQAIAAQSAGLGSQSLANLQFLVKTYPQFVPGHIRLVQALNDMGRKSEAMAVLEQAVTLHPNQPDLSRLQVEALRAANRPTEAAIAARRFALLNSSNAFASEFTKLADENLKLAQKKQQPSISRNILGGVLRGTLSYLLTNRSSNSSTSLPLSILQGVLSSPQQSISSQTNTATRTDMQQMLDLLLSSRR